VCKPTVPDPSQVANAQFVNDLKTSIGNTAMSNASTFTPLGSVDYQRAGNFSYKAPDNTDIVVPTWKVYQTLSPDQQKLLDLQESAGINLGQLATDQSSRLNSILNTPYDPRKAGLPTEVTKAAKAPILSGVGNIAPNLQNDLGNTDFTQARNDVVNALYSRMNPQLENDRNAMMQRLANQGITSGSKAWNEALDAQGRKENDARMQAVLAGSAEQDRLFNEALGAGNFKNTALNQDFANQLQQAGYNTGIDTQNFNAQNQYMMNQQNLRQQALQEDLAIRNQPISEISALMSGSQPTLPQFQPFQGSQMQSPNIGQYMYQAANMQNQANNAMMGGLFGLGGSLMTAGLLRSDRRAKENIRRVGTLDNGLPVYAYNYIGYPATQIGLMADEVEKVKPEAVTTTSDGFKAVYYDRAVEA